MRVPVYKVFYRNFNMISNSCFKNCNYRLDHGLPCNKITTEIHDEARSLKIKKPERRNYIILKKDGLTLQQRVKFT